MKKARSFVRGSASLRRERGQFEKLSGSSFLIVTEGEKTEPNYLRALCKKLHLHAAQVEIVHPDGPDPLTLTWHAIKLRDERQDQVRKGKSNFQVAYDEVWVVFDLEKTHDQRRDIAAKAMSLPDAEGVRFAYSDPCFEYWLLLHEEETTAQFADSKAVIKRLKHHWNNYAKGSLPSSSLLDKVPTAVTHAHRCRKNQEASGQLSPSTMMDLLVRSLNAATRKHLQYNLNPNACGGR